MTPVNMVLKRCPACRTFCDATAAPRCFGCGALLPPETAPARVYVPQALTEGKQSRKVSNVLLAVLALPSAFGCLSIVVSPDSEPVARVLVGLLLAVSATLGILALTGKGGPGVATAGRTLLKLFAFVALVGVGIAALGVALVLLMFCACALGFMK